MTMILSSKPSAARRQVRGVAVGEQITDARGLRQGTDPTGGPCAAVAWRCEGAALAVQGDDAVLAPAGTVGIVCCWGSCLRTSRAPQVRQDFCEGREAWGGFKASERRLELSGGKVTEPVQPDGKRGSGELRRAEERNEAADQSGSAWIHSVPPSFRFGGLPRPTTNYFNRTQVADTTSLFVTQSNSWHVVAKGQNVCAEFNLLKRAA